MFMLQLFHLIETICIKNMGAGASPGFLKGRGPISLGSLKKGHQILKGGVQYISLPKTTNLAYLDAKE